MHACIEKVARTLKSQRAPQGTSAPLPGFGNQSVLKIGHSSQDCGDDMFAGSFLSTCRSSPKRFNPLIDRIVLSVVLKQVEEKVEN